MRHSLTAWLLCKRASSTARPRLVGEISSRYFFKESCQCVLRRLASIDDDAASVNFGLAGPFPSGSLIEAGEPLRLGWVPLATDLGFVGDVAAGVDDALHAAHCGRTGRSCV